MVMRLLMLGVALLASGEAAAQFAPGGTAPRPPATDGWSRPVARAPLIVDNARSELSWLLDGDIRRGRQAGQLTRRELHDLRREQRQIAVLRGRYARDGLSAAERRELDLRAGALRDRVNRERVN